MYGEDSDTTVPEGVETHLPVDRVGQAYPAVNRGVNPLCIECECCGVKTQVPEEL